MQTIIKKLKEIKGCSFINISNYYSKSSETIQSVLVNVGVDYAKAKQKDLETLKALNVKDVEISESNANKGVTIELLEQARVALVKAIEKPSKARSKAQQDAYLSFNGVKGLRMHVETQKFFIYGMIVRKTETKVLSKKADTRRPLTVAKDVLRKTLKHTKFRQYEIQSLTDISIKGDTLTII